MDQPDPDVPVDLPVHGGSGPQPGVELEDKEALATLIEVNDGDRRGAG